jgi:hypothetical protein
MLDDPQFKSWEGQEIFFFSKMSTPVLGPKQSPLLCQDCFPGVKWPGHEVDHSFLVSRLRMSGALSYMLKLQSQTWVHIVLCTSKAKVNIPCTGLERPWGMYKVDTPKISRRLAHEDSMVVSPVHQLPLHSTKYSWYSLLLETELTLGPECGQKDYVNKNSKDTIRNWTRDFLACSTVP